MYNILNQYRNNRKFVKLYVQIGVKLPHLVGDRGIPSTAMPNLSTT